MPDKQNNHHRTPDFWVAVDWGTSSLRCWAMQKNVPTEFAESNKGMSKLKPDEFEPALLELIDKWLPANQKTSMIACGMVGAKQGWIEAPYMSVPCYPPSIESSVVAPTKDARIKLSILPGLCQASPADVMRGEETLIAGLLVDNAKFSGTVCLPGTHCKWVNIVEGKIQQFTTVITGELFELLSTQSVLRFNVGVTPTADTQHPFNQVFLSTVNEFASAPFNLSSALFSIRAMGLLENTPSIESTARLSGLLIAADVNSMRHLWQNTTCIIVGKPALADLYQLAIQCLADSSATNTNTQIKHMGDLVLKGLSQHAQQAGAAQ